MWEATYFPIETFGSVVRNIIFSPQSLGFQTDSGSFILHAFNYNERYNSSQKNKIGLPNGHSFRILWREKEESEGANDPDSHPIFQLNASYPRNTSVDRGCKERPFPGPCRMTSVFKGTTSVIKISG